eukprot:scaffold1975_cov54-Attheya_sp.AAC.3
MENVNGEITSGTSFHTPASQPTLLDIIATQSTRLGSCSIQVLLRRANHYHTIRTFSHASNSTGSRSSLDGQREAILEASLEQVHEYGWTGDAIAAGVLKSQCPPLSIGLVEGGESDLVAYFMDQCNHRLNLELSKDSQWVNKWRSDRTPMAQRLEDAIRLRLEMTLPFCQSQRWHEGMALGASGTNAATTARQLDEMVTIMVTAVTSVDDGATTMGPLERAAIGGVYVATEFHLLTDHGDCADTWTFLHQRVQELELMASSTSWDSLASGQTAVAATAVVASLGGAVVSLLQPAAFSTLSTITSSLLPQIQFILQRQTASVNNTTPASTVPKGGQPSDYDFSDLPPFESDSNTTK